MQGHPQSLWHVLESPVGSNHACRHTLGNFQRSPLLLLQSVCGKAIIIQSAQYFEKQKQWHWVSKTTQVIWTGTAKQAVLSCTLQSVPDSWPHSKFIPGDDVAPALRAVVGIGQHAREMVPPARLTDHHSGLPQCISWPAPCIPTVSITEAEQGRTM